MSTMSATQLPYATGGSGSLFPDLYCGRLCADSVDRTSGRNRIHVADSRWLIIRVKFDDPEDVKAQLEKISEGLLPGGWDKRCGRGHVSANLLCCFLRKKTALSVNESQMFVGNTVGTVDNFCAFKHIPKKNFTFSGCM